jgi:hypothetical protein
MENQKLQISIQEYNKRIIKICTDMYDLTQNKNYTRFRDLLQCEIESGNPAMYLFKHTEHVDESITTRILDQNDITFFEDQSLQHQKISFELLDDLRSSWKMLNNDNKQAIFKCIQNALKIVRYVQQNCFEDLLRLCL